jgi:hypothetical protein
LPPTFVIEPVLGVGLSSADQCNIADTARQYCLGSAADSPTRSLSKGDLEPLTLSLTSRLSAYAAIAIQPRSSHASPLAL